MLAGLRGIDGEIWKASRVDGIPAWRTYIFVVIPMMRGVFVTTLVIIASGIVRVYDLVVATTNGGPGFASEMPAKYVYDYHVSARQSRSGALPPRPSCWSQCSSSSCRGLWSSSARSADKETPDAHLPLPSNPRAQSPNVASLRGPSCSTASSAWPRCITCCRSM